MNLTDYQSNRPVNWSNRPVNRSNRPVSRSEPVEHAILNLTGFRSKRSGKPLPDRTDLTGPVGLLNPSLKTVLRSSELSIAWQLAAASQLRIARRTQQRQSLSLDSTLFSASRSSHDRPLPNPEITGPGPCLTKTVTVKNAA